MHAQLRFSEVAAAVDAVPGYYEIHMVTGVLLKLGIAENLRTRLLQHGASLQSCLKGKKEGDAWSDPSDVVSKRSILAKHLYFDASIAPGYDLSSELGRQLFLEEQCRIVVKPMASRAEARKYEKAREQSGLFRYVGRVVKR